MSDLQNKGLTVVARIPLATVAAANLAALVDDKLADYAEAYQHEIAADGGFWSARLSLRCSQLYATEWLHNGLGRDITVSGPGGQTCWQGFVNEVTLSAGNRQAQRGPLLAVHNRVKVAYQSITYNTNPPIPGVATATAWADNNASQGIYGIGEFVLNGGTGLATAMEQARDTYLAENSEPPTSRDLSFGRQSEVGLELNCLGYVHFFGRYVYTQATTSMEINLSDKIRAVITADPNGIFDTSFNRIAANTTQVGDYENDNRAAWEVLKELVGLGDASFNRYFFGVYEARTPVYSPQGMALTYYAPDLAEDIVLAVNGGLVQPWDVRPATWLALTDINPGQAAPTALRGDDRNVFAESVRYSTPWGLEINGQKLSRLDQLLARAALQ